VNGGWRVMGVALAFERGVMGGTNPGIPLLRHFHDWAAQTGLAVGSVGTTLARARKRLIAAHDRQHPDNHAAHS